jgi:hypothetical protein
MSLYRYIGLVILLMVPFFTLWYALGALPSAPALWLSQLTLNGALPNVLEAVTIDNHQLLALTRFGELDGQVVALAEAEYQLAFPLNTRMLSYSVPFYAALHFASRLERPLERFAWGLFVLWSLMFLGIVAVTLKNLMLGLGDLLYTHSTVPLPPPAAIALLYQFSTLIVPTLAPVALWAWSIRKTPQGAALLGRHAAPPP